MQLLRILSVLPLAAVGSAQWVAATPTTTPPARLQAGMAFDSLNNRAVLFGGAPVVGFSNLNDTWAFDGTDWTQLAPAAAPSARAGVEMVYDSLRQVIVMYGGGNQGFFGGPSIDETWEFDGTTWTQVSTAHTPGGLTWYGMAYDSGRNRTVIYGGLPDNSFPIDSDQTWEYDGVDWTHVATATSPGPLENQGMCYDATLGKVIMFGGIDVQVGGNNTVWSYDGVDWTALPVAGASPIPRTLDRMTYDSSRGVCVMHGGNDFVTGNIYNDTWEFDGASWTELSGTATVGRQFTNMVYDSNRRLSVLFGGVDQSFNGLADTLEWGPRWQAFGIGCLGSNGVPVLSAAAGPRLGHAFTTTLSNLIPAAPFGVVATGFSETVWGVTPLPLDMTAFGLTGCTLYTAPDIIELALGGGGSANYTLNIPADPYFLGVELFQQGFSFELPGWNPFGGVLSNASHSVIGG